MASDPSSGVRSADQLTRPQRWFTSAGLVSVTVLVAIVCIVLLSSTLTQSRLTNLNIDGVELTIRKLDNVAQLWTQLRAQRERQAAKLAAAEEKQLELVPVLKEAESRAPLATKEIEGALAGFYFLIKDTEQELAKAINRQGYEDQIGKIKAAKAELVGRRPELKSTIDAIEAAYERYRQARQDLGKAQAAIAGPNETIKLYTAAVAATEKKQQAVFNLIKQDLDAPGRLRVENAFFELNIANYEAGINPNISRPRRIVSRLFYTLLTLQPDLLTLFLVIGMGVLGSALHITHSYFMKNQAQTLGRYFQRISVGALTALVIFIVAKAGVPVIADPTRLGGDATINPYFVSFLAIISGLLSENAIANIQAQGTRLLGAGGAGPDRWTRTDLTGGLEAEKLTVAAIAQHLGVDVKVADAKLKGQAEIKPDEQKIIALVLRRDPRDIFTDIPPPKT